MIKRRLLIFLLFMLFSSAAFGQEYSIITPGHLPRLPEAFYYRKAYKVQWWYFTGHLFDERGREFGYELTFFAVGIQKRHYKSRFGVNDIYITHFAVSDILNGKFYFCDDADSGAFGLSGAAGDALKVWSRKASLEGSPQRMRIKAADKYGTLGLVLYPAKPLVLNGEHGYSRKSALSPDQSSLYFSYTRMKTEGVLTLGGTTHYVNGESWFDREISSPENGRPFGGSGLKGWDWFGIQLSDRREIMLYILRNRDSSIDHFSSGTFVYNKGRYRRLQKDDFSVDVLNYYRSQKTGARYPSLWEIRIPSEGVALKITPLIRDQEFVATFTTGNSYWEGDCAVALIDGTAAGRAYVELTGY